MTTLKSCEVITNDDLFKFCIGSLVGVLHIIFRFDLTLGSHCNFTSLQSFVSWLLRGDPSDVNREHASVDIELRVRPACWYRVFLGYLISSEPMN